MLFKVKLSSKYTSMQSFIILYCICVYISNLKSVCSFMSVDACDISPVGLLYNTVLPFHLFTPYL